MFERVASRQFVKELNHLSTTNPDVISVLGDFLDFKCAKTGDRYGKKDYPFSNGKLKGFHHFHLMHGKLILIYRIGQSQVRLCCIISHKAIDGTPSARLVSYLEGLADTDFSPIIV